MSADDDYANSAYIPDGDSYFARWAADGAMFRGGHADKSLGRTYGAGRRQTYDLYRAKGSAFGTVVIVHGGYWMACSPRDFSQLAAGALAAGYDCAMPSYTLAPDARISEITVEIQSAISAIAAATQGPLYLVGHSAGAHLVARMVCADVRAEWQTRIARVMPISPLSDLRPLMQTTMNATLGLDPSEAARESPVNHSPHDVPVTVWVGGAERPAFLNQARWLAQAWDADYVAEPDRHHFDVIEGLRNVDSLMMQGLLQAPA